MDRLEFSPELFLEMMRAEIPLYEELEDETARATEAVEAQAILELGFGTGETTRRVLARHPGASLVGIDGSTRMLAVARIEGAELRRAELQDPLPEGPFDLVVSCLAVRHLDAAAKRDLFRRVADVLAEEGVFVYGDVVVPEHAADAVSSVTPEYDYPDSVDDQVAWLRDAGFEAECTWRRRDVAVLRARRPRRKRGLFRR